MNELVQDDHNAEVAITSLDIAKRTGKTHPNVLKDIRRMLKELEIDEVRFDSIYKDAYNRDMPMYILPKREAMILASGYNVNLRAKIIDRLDKLEKEAQEKQRPKLPGNYIEALEFLVVAEKDKIALNKTISIQSATISNVIHSHNTYTTTQVAKELITAMSAVKLNRILVEAKVIYKQGETYQLHAYYANAGMTSIKETEPDEDGKTYKSMRWTAVGKDWILDNIDDIIARCSPAFMKELALNEPLTKPPKVPKRRVLEGVIHQEEIDIIEDTSDWNLGSTPIL